eukprot:CAMPEP_0180808122 /NCGR_PEP_ID=MMETSP1038_2-20121128/63625_1 /TAXON_ID=632150 /ORGANISM="Azadinium spinosum, Strain 3D9" /LENGTH=55 /DNA_ID=CAMNT_0022849209 /DNA_START=12 /DNA_END=176 /DNA_ORIENTATION=+
MPEPLRTNDAKCLRPLPGLVVAGGLFCGENGHGRDFVLADVKVNEIQTHLPVVLN